MPRGRVQVEVRPTVAPDGRPAVLLQLPNGYVLLNPEDARQIARHLTVAAEQAD